MSPPPRRVSGDSRSVLPDGVGARIRGIRDARRMLLRDLSRASGVSVPMICHVENGRRRPSMLTLVRLAEGLGVAERDLLVADRVCLHCGQPLPADSPGRVPAASH